MIPEVDVAVVGAGPVGLLLACLLRSRGLSVKVLERRESPSGKSAAIGITPPSLDILRRIGVEEEFLRQGVKVRDCFLHGSSGPAGKVSFRNIPGPRPFILSLPQAETSAILRRRLGAEHVLMGCEVTDLVRDGKVSRLIWSTGSLTARHVVGCDGARSRIRELLGIRAPGASYRCHFLMGDFVDRTGMGDEAHLFFRADGSAESFPLPGGMRRWVVQTEARHEAPAPALLIELVRSRTGVSLSGEDQINEASFTPRRFNCERYHDGSSALCGDAAHGMSPAGGQGMNTGFADAELLAEVLASRDPARLLPAYTRYRRKAAGVAIFRAGWGMALGTWTGGPLSFARDLILRHLLCRGPIGRRMGPFYAMQTMPYGRLADVPVPELHTTAESYR